MENQAIIIICFVVVIAVIAFVVIFFLYLAKRLEVDYLINLKNKKEDLLGVMEKDTIFDSMVRGGRVLQYVTILGAFAAVFFLALLKVITGELAGTIIGMIITGVIGAEAGARVPGEAKKEVKLLMEELRLFQEGKGSGSKDNK